MTPPENDGRDARQIFRIGGLLHGPSARLWTYATAHVGGRLPPWRSYLVNWVVVNQSACAVLLFGATEVSHAVSGSGWLVDTIKLPYYLLSFVIYGWGAIGAWRALRRHETRRWSRAIRHVGRATIVIATATIAWQVRFDHVRYASLSQVGERALALVGRPTATVVRSADGRRVTLRGAIGFGSAARLSRLLDESPSVHAIDLSSPGGLAYEGLRLGRLIRQRNLDTHVPYRCESACTLLLLAGRNRTADNGARIGFHASRSGGPFGDGRGSMTADNDIYDYYLAAGLSKAFIARAQQTPGRSMWFPSVETMRAEGILTADPDEDDDD